MRRAKQRGLIFVRSKVATVSRLETEERKPAKMVARSRSTCHYSTSMEEA